MIIHKSDKGTLVIVDGHDNIKEIDNILSDQNKFTKANLKDDTLLNFAVNQECVDMVLKNLLSLRTGVSGNWIVKSKLPPRSGCSLEAVEPHP